MSAWGGQKSHFRWTDNAILNSLMGSWKTPSKTLGATFSQGVMGWCAQTVMLKHPTPLCSAPSPGPLIPTSKPLFFSTQGVSQTCLPPVWKLPCVQLWWRGGRWCITHITSSSIAARVLPVLLSPPPQRRGLVQGSGAHGAFEKDLVFTPSSTTCTLSRYSEPQFPIIRCGEKKGYLNTGEDWNQDAGMF